jgi:hypothetical protein
MTGSPFYGDSLEVADRGPRTDPGKSLDGAMASGNRAVVERRRIPMAAADGDLLYCHRAGAAFQRPPMPVKARIVLIYQTH